MRIRFSSPVRKLSTAENCPVTPMACANRVGIRRRIVAGDQHFTAVGADQGGENLDHRGLACPVGAEQGKDRPFRHLEIDAVEHQIVAV